jgi:hypothetical protein
LYSSPIFCGKIKDDGIGLPSITIARKNSYLPLVGKPEKKKSFQRSVIVDNIKMNFKYGI